MKLRSRVASLMQLVLIIAALPFLSGQSECNVNEDLIKNLNNLVSQKFQPAPGNEEVFVTNLSFIDADSGQMYAQTEESLLINKAVEDGIQRAASTNQNIRFNQSGHMIDNTGANVNKLIEMLNDANATPEERQQSIIAKLMDPNNVDVIVTGTVKDLSSEDAVQLIPLVINRGSENTVYKELTFPKAEYICPDPVNAKKKTLCADAHEELAKVVKELLETL